MPGSDQPPLSTTLSSIGTIKPRPIVKEMEESYLDYAMSVIVSRALPDARDGLKPVHRRILFSMHELGLSSAAKSRKSALVVGDVLGKYHPHGEAPVYEALVRMAQDFAMRYPLVQGQGNFGSIDGDNPAAMRYTEVRMGRITEQMLQDIERDTVEFRPNYDDTRREPCVLPAKFPNLLLNGTVGIAVGMATNIPPHNLREIASACVHLAQHSDATIEDLLHHIRGPDFPTAGIVYDRKAITQAYLTGRGTVVVRGRAEITEIGGNRSQIVITEIPYQVNKATLIERAAELVNAKVIQGVADIRDESDRQGIRIVIDVKKDGYPQKILNQLYKSTDLQSSFGYNMIALADGLQPRLLNLKELLEIFLVHRHTIVTRRVTFDRERAKERAHILEGLATAIHHIDEVVATIRRSATKEEAKVNLMKKFKLSPVQAEAILQMPLKSLANLERQKIEEELKERKAFIRECDAILEDPKRVTQIVLEEIRAIATTYGDERRTQIIAHAVGELSAKDTIPNAPMIVTLTTQGYVKRLSPAQFRAQHRGGKGVKGMTTKEEDEILCLLHASNHDDLLCFTNTGRVFSLPAYELPQGSRVAKGQAIVNLLQLQPGERITAMLKSKLEGKKFLFMATQEGTVKKTSLEEFSNIRRSGLIAMKAHTGDKLKWVVATSGDDEIFILTKKGKAIRFPEGDVRPMGRAAAGVRGVRLGPGDYVVEVASVTNPEESELLVVMENGLSKMTKVMEYRFQGRGGTGVKAAQITPKTGDVVGGFVLTAESRGDLICISKLGQTIRLKISDIPSRSRATQGVIIMRLDQGDKVASLSLVLESDTEESPEDSAGEHRKADTSPPSGEKGKAAPRREASERAPKREQAPAPKLRTTAKHTTTTALKQKTTRRAQPQKAVKGRKGKGAARTAPRRQGKKAKKVVARAKRKSKASLSTKFKRRRF